MFKFVMLLCLFNVVCLAYDFKDSAYNEHVMQELIELSNEQRIFEIPQLRHKRHAENDDEDPKCKPKKTLLNKCCNVDEEEAETEVLYDKYKEWKKQCIQDVKGNRKDESVDIFSCDKVNKTKEDLLCISQCVGQKAKMIDKDGNLIESFIINHVKNELPASPWQKEVALGIANICIAEAKQMPTSTVTGETDIPSGKCSPISMQLGHCIWREFAKSCPKKLQIDSTKCQKVRETMIYDRYVSAKVDMVTK